MFKICGLFCFESLCLHSVYEMMILHFDIYECAYLCMYVFFRLWLEKRPVISQSPATQDRLCIWAPRYWHALWKSFFSSLHSCSVFKCGWIVLFFNIAVCSHHDSQDLERGMSDDMLGRYVQVAACKSILRESYRILCGLDLCCFLNVSLFSELTVWWNWSIFLRLFVWPGHSTKEQLKLCMVGVMHLSPFWQFSIIMRYNLRVQMNLILHVNVFVSVCSDCCFPVLLTAEQIIESPNYWESTFTLNQNTIPC